VTDLKDDILRRIRGGEWQPLQLSLSDVETLACRVQIGTPEADVVAELGRSPRWREVRLAAPPTGFHYRRGGSVSVRELDLEAARPVDAQRVALGEPVRSFQDAVKEVGKVYEFYDRLCVEEYGLLRQDLKETELDPKGGLPYYKRIRPLYYKRGVDPPAFLQSIVLNVWFLDRVRVVGGAHPDLVRIFERAQISIESLPLGPLLKQAIITTLPVAGKKKTPVIGGWNPRPIDGNPDKLSLHALGLATDIDPVQNEHLKGKRAETIDRVLDYLSSTKAFPYTYRVLQRFVDYNYIGQHPDEAESLALEMRTRLQRISDAFQKFVVDGFAKEEAKQPLDPAVKPLWADCKKAFGVKLNSTRTQGLYDQHLVLVWAMIKAGARYGGEFHTKDQHHFEVRSWRDKPPKCLSASPTGKGRRS
jgi:hypothetical protein